MSFKLGTILFLGQIDRKKPSGRALLITFGLAVAISLSMSGLISFKALSVKITQKGPLIKQAFLNEVDKAIYKCEGGAILFLAVSSLEFEWIMAEFRKHRVFLQTEDDHLRTINELNKENKALSCERQELLKKHEDMEQFISAVSHELRNPLSAIRGFSSLVGEYNIDDPEFQRFLAGLERNVDHLNNLVTDLVELTRTKTGKVQLRRQAFNLEALVQEVVDSMRFHAATKRISFIVSTDLKKKTFVGDKLRLQQVLWNLFINAVKFSPADGTVEVKAFADDKVVNVSVADDGIGIDPKQLDRIFDRLWQTKDGYQRGGLGLGLSIVKHLVELHGGSVKAQSDGYGKGVVFTVTLPQTQPVNSYYPDPVLT